LAGANIEPFFTYKK